MLVPSSNISGPDDEGNTPRAVAAIPPPKARGQMGCARTFLLALLILAALAAFLFYRAERMAEKSAAAVLDWGGRVRDAVAAVTGMEPRVVVNEQVVFEQAQPVLELAVLERDATAERETEDSWLGSTKRLRVRGLYRVKVGYKLEDGFNVEVLGQSAEVVRLQLPPPRVLSVEQRRVDVLTMDNGLWNHLSSDELTSEVNLLMMEARLKASQNGTPAEAQRLFVEQLQAKLGPGHRVEIVPPLPPKPAIMPDAAK